MAALFLCALLFISCSNSAGSPSLPGKTSDWLFLFYYDADDTTLNDDIYGNMREMEYALAQIRNADGSPKGQYPSITALVLWDGVSVIEAQKNNQKYVHPEGALFELGPDYNLEYGACPGENKYNLGVVTLKGKNDLGDKFIVSSNTIDWTLQARAAGFLDVEPNMADGRTLENFLKWAKTYYSASNVVISLSDHGSGPYKEPYEDSTKADASASISASLCTDHTNGNDRLLTCKNVTDALAAAGYVGGQKPKILWNDVCLQSSAEIVWNYKGCADYLLLSPNIAVSQEFVRIFTSIFKDMTPRDFGKIVVSSYHERYYEEPYPCYKNKEDAVAKRASGCSIPTFSLICADEIKVNELKAAVDNFSDALLALKNGGAEDQELFKSVFEEYVEQFLLSFKDCKGLAYHGSYAFLSDLGYLALQVLGDTKLSALYPSATELVNCLANGDDNLIVYAWGGKRALGEKSYAWTNVSPNQLYITGGVDYISGKAVAVDRSENVFGLTIVACPVFSDPSELGYDVVRNYDKWTGFSTKWGQVINEWFKFH